MPTLDFWYEFASTYSYPAAMRIEVEAAARSVVVRWRPFLLGPIFAQQGWSTSPFNLFAAKGANMWRDLERVCAKQGLPFARPAPFPQNSLLAARVACVLAPEERPGFSRAVYRREFGEGASIDSPDAIAAVLSDCGHDAPAVLEAAASNGNKGLLRAQCEEAMSLGIFGAPSFTTSDGELFWGNDRLVDALDWAARA